jgi:GPH family glycoside/pentoside/hexuronide:cation symporter
VLEGIRGLMFIYPSTLAIATIVVMFFFYKLSDEKYNKIVLDLAKGKNKIPM